MIILNNNIENLPQLIQLLDTIGDVVQVRCHDVLRQSIKDVIGGEGIYITCLVQKRDGSDFFLKFNRAFLPEYVSDVNNHESILLDFKAEIDDYIAKGIVPKPPKGDE